jgi:hypothetical protein
MSISAATPDESRVREQELLYFSRVVAGQCHELANALGIANELCGLHEDTLARSSEGDAGAVQRLGGVARRIQTQIVRANSIVRALSRFAHSLDEPRAACDLRDIVARAVFIAARQARLRQTELRAVLPEGDLPLVDCSPFRLQRAIHAGFELFLDGIPEGRSITASLAFDPAGAVVTLESADLLPCHDAVRERLAGLAALAQAAGSGLREAAEGSGRIVFFVPYAHRDAITGGC